MKAQMVPCPKCGGLAFYIAANIRCLACEQREVEAAEEARGIAQPSDPRAPTLTGENPKGEEPAPETVNDDAHHNASGRPSQFHEVLGYAIQKMAWVGSVEERKLLLIEAKEYTVDEWKAWLVVKVTGVGVLTGIPGGVIGLSLEALDIAYLLAACGRACYGIGHILDKAVDYDDDIPMILAIWAGCAQAAAVGVGSKVALKLGGKAAIAFGSVAATKVGGKVLSKIMPKLVAKLSAKCGSKMVSGFIPLLAAPISGGINFWIATELMEAAEKYYRTEKNVILGEDLHELAEDCMEIGSELV